MVTLDAQPGTYALVLRCTTEQDLVIGRLGTLAIRPGRYVYVGSAMGPGGLAARIARHGRQDKKRRWHIDYLTAVLPLEEVWFTADARRQECPWAELISRLPGASVPLAGFGSSDCTCHAHLYFFEAAPSWQMFQRRLKEAVVHHGPVHRFRQMAM